MEELRCGQCDKKLAMARFTEIQIKCPRCRAFNHLKANEPPHSAKSALKGEAHDTTNHSMDRRQTQAC